METMKLDLEIKYCEIFKSNFLMIKYYPLKSIRNYIYHFDQIKDISIKQIVFYNLNTYFDYIKLYPVENMQEAIELHNKYIVSVGKIYEDMYDFMPILGFRFFVYSIFFSCGIIFILNLSPKLYFLVLTLICGYYLVVLLKTSQKKVHGFLW